MPKLGSSIIQTAISRAPSTLSLERLRRGLVNVQLLVMEVVQLRPIQGVVRRILLGM